MVKKVYFIFKLFILHILLIHPLSSSASFFKRISTDKGLSNRRVFSAVKDQKGYVWFVTGSGIDRYNGETFMHYTLPDRITNTTEITRGIYSNQIGEIYIYSDKMIYKYDSSIEEFIPYTAFKLAKDESIITLYSSAKNQLWVGTNNNLYTINNIKKTQKSVLEERCTVYSVLYKENNYWIATSIGLLQINQTITGDYLLVNNKLKTTIGKYRIQSLYYDDIKKWLWIGTFSNGLKVYDTSTQKIVNTDSYTLTLPIRSITRVNDNSIWVGVDGGGIFSFNRFNAHLENNYSSSSPEETQIKSNNIYTILNDEGLIWICTYTSGIYVYNKNTIIEKIFKHTTTKKSLIDNYVNTILEDSHKNLWFGTNKGLSKYNTTTNQWKHYLQHQDKSHSVVLSIFEDQQHCIWAGGYANDLICIDPKTETITKIHISNRNFKKHYVYDIIQDKKGTLWFGGVIDGLTRYNPITKKTKHYPVKGINDLMIYNKDSLLIATNKGLCLFHISTEKIEFIDLLKMKGDLPQHSLPIIRCINRTSTSSSCIWIGTEQEGLYEYNVSTSTLHHFSRKDGLSSNDICGLQNDSFGRLWISTENGLNCLNPTNAQVETFYNMDGLPSNSFNYYAYTTLSNGNMLWGTPEGAVEINTSRLKKKTNRPFNLRFNRFSLFYSKVVADTPDSPLKRSIDDTKFIQLKHNQHSFAFDFINLSYANNTKSLYTWKLKGFDEQWSTTYNDHRAIYTNIPPGKYQFKVKVSKADNQEHWTQRTIDLEILPPFWSTTWAYLIYTIGLIILLYFIIKVYKDHLSAKESDKRIKFFVNMAHDIRTPLTLIKAPLDEIETEALTHNGQIALQLAKRNTNSLMNIVSQLLDFQKIEREAMNLHIEETEINSFFESYITNFYLLTKEKQLHLDLQLPNQKLCGWFDRKKLSLILDNLLSNSIKYTQTHGNICVKVTLKNNELIIQVIDDGIGISASAQKKLFRRFYRAENAANSQEIGSGIGLLLTKKMVLLHKGTINVISAETIGTTFTVTLPISKARYSASEIVEIESMKILPLEESNEEINKKIRLLLVEDNEELRNYLVHYLQKKYFVEGAEDGTIALEMIQKNTPDFILSDVMMPIISGVELCKKLKSDIRTCHIPVILLTALSERDDIIRGFNSGADDYITKPFELPVLESKINAILKNRALFRKKYIDKTAFEEDSISANNLDNKFMNKVVNFIEDKLTQEDFTIDTIAIEMAMSRSVFYKKIKSLTGQNPQEFIREIKMKKASNLLREQKYTIAEIAYLTGHPNAKYFSTAFKKYYGTPPSQFLEQKE